MSRSRLAVLVAAAFALGGCAAAHRAPPARSQAATPTERATIVYELDSKRPSPLPLVRGSVAGRPTLMVVDTGSGTMAIAGWLARSVALPTTKVAETTHDPSGRPVAMERCEAPKVVVDGLGALQDRPTPVIELPAGFEAANIGVILSPQMLAGPDRTVVVDMPRRELRFAHASEPFNVEGFDVEDTKTCGGFGGGFDGRALTAKATIDGMPTTVEVDTGAVGSPFFVLAETEAGKKLLARPGNVVEKGLSAAGPIEDVTATDVPVRLADRERRVKVSVMPGKRDTHCGIEGRIGLEVLGGCVFVVSERSYRLRCEGAR